MARPLSEKSESVCGFASICGPQRVPREFHVSWRQMVWSLIATHVPFFQTFYTSAKIFCVRQEMVEFLLPSFLELSIEFLQWSILDGCGVTWFILNFDFEVSILSDVMIMNALFKTLDSRFEVPLSSAHCSSGWVAVMVLRVWGILHDSTLNRRTKP